MNTTPRPEILFPEEELARLTGIAAFTLNHLLPAHCGVPGHWRLVSGRTIYTERGVEELATALEALNTTENHAAAHTLRVALRARHETPSRALPWYQREGAMV